MPESSATAVPVVWSIHATNVAGGGARTILAHACTIVAAPSGPGPVVALIAQGRKRIAVGDKVFEYGPGQYLVASVDLPVSGHFTHADREHPALGFGLVIDPSVIADMILTADAADLSTPPDPAVPPAIAVADAPAELIDAVVRLVRLLDDPRHRAVLAPLIEREILWRVMTGRQGAALRQLGLADSGVGRIAQAAGWIRHHFAEPFTVAEVARWSGMSESAFYRNFQAVTAMSPIQFRKQIRLQQARLLLATPDRDVTGVARRVGYENPSQFSREYRRQFGVAPSADRIHPNRDGVSGLLA